MNKKNKKNRIIIILFFLVAVIGFGSQVQAANCGDTNGDGITDTPCACGDTVIGAAGYTYELTGDLGVCSGHGLIVGANNITIDGGNYTITGDGGAGDYGINDLAGYDTVIIQNFGTITNSGISNFYYGIYFNNTTSSTIQNVTANSNNRGIYLDSSSSNNLTSNTLLNNRHDLYNTGTTNTYSSNQFNHNLTSKTLTSAETTKTIDVNGIASFDISIFDPNGVACPDCSYTAVTSPSETVTATKNSNQVTGSFIPTKSGTYSLNFTVTDGSNTTKRRLLFFVGNTVSLATTYYFRGISPTHGQPYGTGKDSKTLLLTAPTSTETEFCGSWVQNFPDDIPNYPLANLSGIDTYSWYKQASGYSYIGIQRYGTYDPNIDPGKSQLVSATSTYTWINKNFTGFNWTMDYSHNWYWLALKLYGSNTYWTTFPANEADADPASWAAHHHPDGSTDPSYADFTYQYTTTPAIKSIFDENIMVLSATADPSDTGIISIVLEDSLTSYTSTMDIVLSSPVRIDFSFDTWDPYYRQWTEEASEPGITATHIISGFAPNNYYVVNKDGALVGLYLSDGLGRITFTCLAGSVFSVMDMETVSGGGAEGGHCFIATATFGTPMASEVRVLSRFRDSYLLTNPIREGFVATYYKVSPRAALFIREHPVLKKAVRGALNPLIWLSRKAVK